MEYKFGLEAEYALIQTNGEFADFSNTNYLDVQKIIDMLPNYQHPGLRIGNAGVKVKNWYIEGDERLNEDESVRDMAFKGIEVRTPITNSIPEAIASLKDLRMQLSTELEKSSFKLAVIGFNPIQESYSPKYTDFEKAYHLQHTEYQYSDISTLSYGPDINLSIPGKNSQELLAIGKRLAYYSPYIVPFSFSSPFYTKKLWEGLSYRTFVRTGLRPAVTIFTYQNTSSALNKVPRIPEEEGRIEFKAFDAIGSDELFSELSYLILGISLSKNLLGEHDYADKTLHELSAKEGFSNSEIHSMTTQVLSEAEEALHANDMPQDFPLLHYLLHERITPAHAMIEQYKQNGTFVMPL